MSKHLMIVLGLGLAAAGASAQTTGNIAVTARVEAVCQVTSTGAMAFGMYNPMSATAKDTAGSVSVACSQGSMPHMTLDNGAQPSGVQRRMVAGGNYLNYDVFKPASNAAGAACAYTAPWDTAGLTGTAAPSIAARSYNICGRIPSGQDVPQGDYADTVVVNVTF
ncbi:MAG: SCPU domain-containing protein [Comamonadaceae bacterium]|nr:MAG: SCPU domain-containing protein [Comamonadaceae bacterium]